MEYLVDKLMATVRDNEQLVQKKFQLTEKVKKLEKELAETHTELEKERSKRRAIELQSGAYTKGTHGKILK